MFNHLKAWTFQIAQIVWNFSRLSLPLIGVLPVTKNGVVVVEILLTIVILPHIVTKLAQTPETRTMASLLNSKLLKVEMAIQLMATRQELELEARIPTGFLGEDLVRTGLQMEDLLEDLVSEDLVSEDPLRPLREDLVSEDPLREDPLREDLLSEDPLKEDPLSEDLLGGRAKAKREEVFLVK